MTESSSKSSSYSSTPSAPAVGDMVTFPNGNVALIVGTIDGGEGGKFVQLIIFGQPTTVNVNDLPQEVSDNA